MENNNEATGNHSGTSLQTSAMVDAAGDEKYVTAGQHRETKKWHGMLMVNHPTPSGSSRYLLACSDKRGWSDSETAIREMNQILSANQQPQREGGEG